MKIELKKLVSDLESRVGFIGVRVSTLNDIEVLFGHLNDSMAQAKHDENQLLYFEEHFREVRILSELMYFTMKELNGELSKIEKIREALFEKVIKNPTSDLQEKSHIAANDMASKK